MLLSQAFERYARDVISFRNQSAKTEEHHNVTKRSLINYAGDIPLKELEFETVRSWKLDMEKRKLSTETVRGYLVRLRVVLAYSQAIGQPGLDPELVRLPKRPDTVPEVVSPAEVTKLIEGTPKLRNKAIISLLYSSGLRVSELCALNRMDVSENYFPVIGKGGKSRLCFVDPRSRDLINRYLSERTHGRIVYRIQRGKVTDRVRYTLPGDNHPALFINDLGQRLTPHMAQEVFKNARRRSGLTINVHPHTMRHSFATNLNVNGASLRAIQLMMGHKSLATTQQYLHLYDSDLKETHEKYHTI